MISKVIQSNELLEIVGIADLDQIARLIDAGANPNFRDVLDGGTCLHRVAGSGKTDTMCYLLEHGADPNILTQNCSTSPLGIAALAGKLEIVRMIIRFGGKLSEREESTGLVAELREAGFGSIAQLLEYRVPLSSDTLTERETTQR